MLLPEWIYISILCMLSQEDQFNVIIANRAFRQAFVFSSKLLNAFCLKINRTNFDELSSDKIRNIIFEIPFKYISVFYEENLDSELVFEFIDIFSNSVETLKLNNFVFKIIEDFYNPLKNFSILKTLICNNCLVESIKTSQEYILPLFSSLQSIAFHRCNANFYKLIGYQKSIENITLESHKHTQNDFPYTVFNEFVKGLSNFKKLNLVGVAASSYLDSNRFTFKIVKLKVHSINLPRFVGSNVPRLKFLESQKGYLKELKIHQLPYDFDGGQLLKYTIEEMKLENFHYGNISLILNGKKQNVEEFSASEVQIQSVLEMFRQFHTIKKFHLFLNKSDIAVDKIYSILHQSENIFNTLEEFVLEDKSEHYRLLGAFLELYRKFTNLKKLELRTPDRNINAILEESLRYMSKLEKIHIISSAPRANQRLEILKRLIPNSKILMT